MLPSDVPIAYTPWYAPWREGSANSKPKPTVPADDQWFFEVVFDYGEHHADVPTPGIEVAQWQRRLDPFSSYRSCFEVRTYRLCQRVLMFHHFEGEENVRAVKILLTGS